MTEPEKDRQPELHSRRLSEQETRAALEALPGFFREALPADSILIASYGWGCNLHRELCYLPMRVGVGWLDRFLAESMDQRIFVPNDSDMTISAPDGRLSVRFSHEAHLHVGGADAALVQRFLSMAPYAGFQIGDAGGSKEGAAGDIRPASGVWF
jgi:hypothetical protein